MKSSSTMLQLGLTLNADLKWVVRVQRRDADVSWHRELGHFCRVCWALILNCPCRGWWRELEHGRLSHGSHVSYLKFLERKMYLVKLFDICFQVWTWAVHYTQSLRLCQGSCPWTSHGRKRSVNAVMNVHRELLYCVKFCYSSTHQLFVSRSLLLLIFTHQKCIIVLLMDDLVKLSSPV